MKGDPAVIEMVEKIAFQNFRIGWTFGKNINLIVCPLCGERLCFGTVEIYETLNEHVLCEESVPRITFVCNNKECKIYKKGYFGELSDGSFYRYREDCDKLEGEPLDFKDTIPDLAISRFKHEKYEYTSKGIYIGPNWESKMMKKLYRIIEDIRYWLYKKKKKGKIYG